MVILFTADWHLKLGQKNVPLKWARNRYYEFFDQIRKIEKEVEKKRKALDTQDGRRLRSAFEHYKLLKDTNELSKEEILPLLEREVSYMEKINKQAKEKLIADVERFKQMGKIITAQK